MATTTKAERERGPERTAAQDENTGLAARLVDLRKVVDDHRKANERELSTLRQLVAGLEQQVSGTIGRVDLMTLDFERRCKDLDTAQREAAEQVRAAGEIARKMTDHMQALDELREVASDPHEVVKPLRKDIAQLRADLDMLGKQIDIRFEQMPRARPTPAETRGDHELETLRADVKRMSDRLRKLEQ